MLDHPRRILFLSLILLIFSLLRVKSSIAESAFLASLSPPDISDFPHITTYLDIHDFTGAFVHGLSPQDVTLQENGAQLTASELQEKKPGVQFVIAISPGESFVIRDSFGVSRYEYLLQNILSGSWTDQPLGIDDFSLITKGGPQLNHSSNVTLLESSLGGYLPADENFTPSLEVLASALQVASDPTARPGMERAVLFITPPQGSEVSLGLQSIIVSAIQQNIRIYVWLVASPEIFDLTETELLRNLADQTHATFFAFSRDEPVPDLETLLEPLRYSYQLGYDSQITTQGSHQVAAQVMVGSDLITTDPRSFELNLQAPLPEFLDHPAEIVRAFSSLPSPEVAGMDNNLLPAEQVIEIQVTFPDGFDRSLVRTSLYVDGALAVENTTPPFDQFIWDLRPYMQAGTHILSVEALDDLGIIGKSDETSIKITLPNPTQGVMVTFSQNRLLIIGVILAISVSVLILVLIIGGRIHPKPYPGQVTRPVHSIKGRHSAGYRENLPQHKNPVTRPINNASILPTQARSRLKTWIDRLPWFPAKEEPVPALAYLLPLAGPDETTLPAPLQVIADEASLGSDPQLANLVISDPSIEGLHARIHHEGKSFLISDNGTIAGTWVNFNPVPPGGTYLEHAAIIHLGQVGFRFILAEPDQLRKIVVTPLEPDP